MSKTRWRRAVILLASAVVSVVLLFVAASRVDVNALGEAVRGADPVLLAAGALLSLVTFAGFAVRWRALLPDPGAVGAPRVFSAVMIGYMANSLLPLRVGEVARASLVARDARLPVVVVLATIAVERILDLASVLAIAGALSLFLDLTPAVRTGIVSLSATGLVILLGLLFVARRGERLAAVTSKNRLAVLYSRFAAQLTQGASALLRWRALLAASAVTALAWVAAAGATMLFIRAFHLPVPWYGALAVLTLVNLGSALPSAPGAVGVYHYFAVLALRMWDVDPSRAFAYALVTHALSIAIAVVAGIVALARRGVSLRQLVPDERQPVVAGSQ